MQHPFKHPLASYAAATVLGYRRNGSPIYAIAGGSGEGEGGSGSEGGTGTGNEATGQGGEDGKPGTGAETTDWQAKYQEALANSRKWEARSKENNAAKTELEKLQQAAMTEHEKAVEAAKAEGRTSAATEYGAQLAAARFEAAAAKAGLDLGDAADLIDKSKFVGTDGTVDTAAIDAAVKKLAVLAPARGPGRSGADLGGGTGDQPADIHKQIEDATKRRDFPTVIRLKRQLSAVATT